MHEISSDNLTDVKAIPFSLKLEDRWGDETPFTMDDVKDAQKVAVAKREPDVDTYDIGLDDDELVVVDSATSKPETYYVITNANNNKVTLNEKDYAALLKSAGTSLEFMYGDYQVELNKNGLVEIGCKSMTLDELEGDRGTELIQRTFVPRTCYTCNQPLKGSNTAEQVLKDRDALVPILRERLAQLQDKPKRKTAASKAKAGKKATKKSTKKSGRVVRR